MNRELVGVLAGVGLAGCSLITDSFLTNEFSGDPFPVAVDTSTGAIIVGMRQDGQPDRDAVLELMSPLTVNDTCPEAGAACATTVPQVSFVDLTLLGQRAGGALDLPRARFPETQLVAMHPCECASDDPTCNPEQCTIGSPAAPRPFGAIFGPNALAGDAIRLRLGDNQIFVLPDVGGSNPGRSLDCDSVFASPYRGGGTLVIAGTELPFGNLRIALQACLGPDPDPDPDPSIDPRTAVGPLPDPATFRTHGADVLLVVSTSIGISMLGEAAYERYRLAHPETAIPALAALPPDAVYLPAGLVRGRRATIDKLALVAAPTSNALSPCRQLYAHRLLTTYELTDPACHVDGLGNSKVDCPCKDGSLFCPVPAILELAPLTGIDVLVVPDTERTLQALRTELRPDQPEVDGVLGTNALRSVEIDVDYPHDRLLGRCRDATCVARPQLAQSSDVCQIKRCFTGITSHHGCVDDPLPKPILPN